MLWHCPFKGLAYEIAECCTVGWSDLVHFCYFRKATGFSWLGIFLWVQFPKICEFRQVHACHTGGKVFIFKKSQRPYKFIYFLKIWRNLFFTSKNNRQKKIQSKKKYFKYFFSFQKMGKTVFDVNNSKNIFGEEYCFNFSFYKIKVAVAGFK